MQRLDFACDQPAVAASLEITSSGNGRRGCELGTLGGQSYAAGRVNLRWLASESLEINLIGDLTNDRSEASAAVLLRANNLPVMGPQWGPWFNVKPGGYYTYETFTDTTTGPGPGFTAYALQHAAHQSLQQVWRGADRRLQDQR